MSIKKFKLNVIEKVVIKNSHSTAQDSFLVNAADLDEIEEVSSSDDEGGNVSLTAFRESLTNGDLRDISENRMVDDSAIKTFQSIIRKSQSDVIGLEPPGLGDTHEFSVHKETSFVQILHTGSAHWVVVSTYGCRLNEVYLIDTSFRGRLTVKLKRQICAIVE